MLFRVHILIIILVAYVVLAYCSIYLQDYFLFKPKKHPKDFNFYYKNQQVSEYNFWMILKMNI